MSDKAKVTDQGAEGERGRRTAAKASAENFTAEQQAQPSEKFTTYSGEKPDKVLLAAMQGETLEAFTARTKRYHEEQEKAAKNRPAVQPLRIGGYEDGSEVTAASKQKPIEKLKAEKQTKHEQISQSATHMAIEAEHNPAMQPVAKLREYADKLPPGEKKEEWTKLSRELAAESSPAMRAHYQRKEAHQNPWEAFRHLTPEQQKKVLEAFRHGSDIAQDDYKGTTKKVSESIFTGLSNPLKALYESFQGAGKFVHDVYFDHKAAVKTGGEIGDNIGKMLVAGVKLGDFARHYAEGVHKSGDYNKPVQDLQLVGQILNEQWEAMPLDKKAEKGSELIAGIGIAGVGEKWHKLAKSGKLVDMLDGLAEALVDQTPAAKARAAEHIKNFINELLVDKHPIADTANGVKMPVPKSTAPKLDDYTVQMSSRSDRAKDWQGELAREVPSSRGEGKAFRGDHDIYSPVNEKGRRKAHINEEGDLSPADPRGVYKGRGVSVAEHIEAQACRRAKEHSPYISFGTTDGVIAKYGGKGIELNLQGLRDAIAKGEAPGVKIIEHEELVEKIRNSYFKRYEKIKLLEYVAKDKEILVQGVIPKRFITILGNSPAK